MNFDSMKKEYIYKVLKGMPANIFMLLLVVANYAVYVNLPGDIFNYSDKFGIILVFIYLPPYLIIVFAGIFALIKSLYNILIGKEVHIVTRIVTYCALFSLLLVSYGTFFKGSVNDFKRKLKWEKSLIIKSYGGEFNNYKEYIWRNDTIMYRYFVKREGIDTKRKWFLDTMLIDAANELCYWTHSPELKYDIIFDHRHKFDESPKNMTFGPFDYMGKFEYIINSVNNKPLDQYYCDSRTYCKKNENDSVLFFLVDSPEKMGYVQFRKDGSIVTFSDSSSNIIKAANDSCVHRYDVMVPFQETAKENGMPLLKIEEHHVHECGSSFFRNYYDVEKKKIVLRVQTREKVDDYRFIDVRLFDYYSDVSMPVESYCDRELSQKDGYPVIRYVKLLEGDTLEVGRYEMENGEYVKKVSRAGDYDFAKTN